MIEAHVAHPVNGGLDILDGIPGQLAVCNLRQLLVKLIIKLEEIVELLAVNGDPLLEKVLLQLIALAVGDHQRRATNDRTFDGLSDKTPILHLR